MSNRADFLEMREREAFENPQIEPEPVEKKPICIDDWLEKYEAAQKEKEEEVFGDMLNILNINHSDMKATIRRGVFDKPGLINSLDFNTCFRQSNTSDIECLNYHNHAKPLTDVEKLYHAPGVSKQEKEERLNKMKEGFKKLRNE